MGPIEATEEAEVLQQKKSCERKNLLWSVVGGEAETDDGKTGSTRTTEIDPMD